MSGLTAEDVADLTAWRRDLHRAPELSGQEAATAVRVRTLLAPLAPDRLLDGLGGHGVAAVWNGAAPGPTVMFRAELDALPIAEISDLPYRSEIAGRGHLCGHDGHMSLLAGLAKLLARRPPARGRAVLLFQPAEEDGSGAAAVIADPRFGQIAPDWAFAIHNMPGLPLGQATLRPGPANCASVGWRLVLAGREAHAAQPETGISPAGAIRVTLRAVSDAGLAALEHAARQLVARVARRDGLRVTLTRHDHFAACVNHPEAVARLIRALDARGVAHMRDSRFLPMRASEDFGRFGVRGTRAAMLLLGAGQAHPALHNPDYDFPDALIAPGAAMFEAVLRDLLGPRLA